MNRVVYFAFLTVLAIACFSCRKDPDNVQFGQIRVEQIDSQCQFIKETDSVFAKLTGRCYYTGTLEKLAIRIGLKEDFSDATTRFANINDRDFSATTSELLLDTTYYYQFVVSRYSEEFGKEMEWEDDSVYRLSTYGINFPEASMIDVMFVSTNLAMGCGMVIDDGEMPIIERGICWGFQTKPTIDDNCRFDTLGLEEMYVQLDNLVSGHTYYARAYVKNRYGTAYSSNEVCFKTKTGNVTVETLYPSEIAENSAMLKIKITNPTTITTFNNVSNYGFLLGTTPKTEFFMPIHHGSSSINHVLNDEERVLNLDNSTLYYYRTYYIVQDTIFGNLVSFTTSAANHPSTNELTGAFSISETQQVRFSPGNLQYQAVSNKWRFAQNQWDCIGKANNNVSSSYYGWIDLFGWGTSGYDHGAVCYQPWSISKENNNYLAYGEDFNNLYDLSGRADWGSNTIFIGDNASEGWRTLTDDEWSYLLFERITPSGIRFAKAKVNNINGVIVLSDDWRVETFSLNNTNTTDSSFNSNIITASDWKNILELSGSIFLPAAGSRHGDYTVYYDNNNSGCYWSASISKYFEAQSVHLYFYDTSLGATYSSGRSYGYSVRLVRTIR